MKAGWTRSAIGECLAPVCKAKPDELFGEAEFDYIDLSAVDQHTKTITRPTRIKGSDAPSRARQVVIAGDVLVSTVRPNLNAVARVGSDLDGAIASTGFCVLRPTPTVDGGFLLHWVCSPKFVHEMVARSTGASYPAVSDGTVRESMLPLPPPVEQRHIARMLDAVVRARRLRHASVDRFARLRDAVFTAIVTDSSSAWQLVRVADLADTSKGGIRTGPFGSQLLHSEFVESGVAVIGIDNAVENRFRWSTSRYISEAKYSDLRRYTVYPGDVLITIMGTCGRAAVVPDDVGVAINTKHLCCISLDRSRCLPSFLHAYFLLHPRARQYLMSRAKGAIMAGLNMGIIKDLPVSLPPLEVQQELADKLERIDRTEQFAISHGEELDALFAALQHRAFAGAL